MQHSVISPRQTQSNTPPQPSLSPMINAESDQDDGAHNFSISVLEWLNTELRKEAEKQEIVELSTDVNVMDRLQNMLSSKATGITIMIVGLFTM